MTKKKQTTKTRKTNETSLTEEYLELIRVKPEQTAKALSQLEYTIIQKPEQMPNKIPRGKMWCCYCGDWKKFGKSKKTPMLDTPRCETCNISTDDFEIKTHNNLWETNKRGND